MTISFKLTPQGRKELVRAVVQAIWEDPELLQLLRSALDGSFRPNQVEGYEYPSDEEFEEPGSLSQFYKKLGFLSRYANVLGQRNLTPSKLFHMTDTEILDQHQVGPALLMDWHALKGKLRVEE